MGIAGNGRGDIAFLNAMGFQASALGNHELDLGTGPFASAIGSETNDGGLYPGAMFPYLSSNLDFTNDENLQDLAVFDGQEAMLVGGSLARSAVIMEHTVGADGVSVSTRRLPPASAFASSRD